MANESNSLKITPGERRAAWSLGAIFSIRLFGIFMVLPVFSIYVEQLPGATPTLIGVAVGVYGLTQALLQMPFGMASDYFGRKPIIIAGLILFIVGSVMVALADSVMVLILGRACQGAGAIGSTLIALLADLTREEQRSKAMAIMGMLIGSSFFLALMAGPIFTHWLGVPSLFWLTALLGLLSMLLLQVAVPHSPRQTFHDDAEVVPAKLATVLWHRELLRLNLGIFVLHAVLTAIFVVIPLTLLREFGIGETQLWLVFLPVLILAFFAMLPGLFWSEKKHQVKATFLCAIGLLGIACVCLALFHSWLWGMYGGLFLFMTAFSFLEATLPAMISRVAPMNSRGTAMGIYSSMQFFGIFVGGVLGGVLYGKTTMVGVCLGAGLLIFLWLLCAWHMQNIEATRRRNQ